ncbi:monovalent cation/H+ antiporter complex subunit F [Streptomyces sp. NPDC004232]|uniref:monovalent cation/H+ antiporter complex subunit F n=1 Tax=Streptomyces sp. NPDC004232 TaxID=3154454 RepID=UPI0033BB3C0E
MNTWLLAIAVLLTLGMPPCVWAAGRDSAVERLPGLSLATSVVTAVLLLTAQGFGRSSFADLGLVLAVLGPAGTLVFSHFLGGRSIEAPDAQTHGKP